MTVNTNSPAGAPVTALTVPDDLSSLDPHSLPWTLADYARIATGATAEKLLSSAIAPVVAAARGYKQISDGGRSAAKKRFQLPDWSTKQGRRLAASLKAGDVLTMPWYTPEAAVQAQAKRRDADFTTIQYRPEVPGVHDNGREAKYEFVVGSESIIGLHPSTPAAWLAESQTVIIAEGLFKADALVSAMLIASDRITDEDLLMDADPDFNHQAHLMTLMEKIERPFRIPVHCIGGVYNWKNNPEWNSISLKSKEVWVAIDGDIATNPQVHRAGSQLWEYLKDKKKATPRLLSPAVITGDDGEATKMGVDDYLFSVGNWEQLLTQLADHLPPKPKGETKLDSGLAFKVDVERGQILGYPKPIRNATGEVVGMEDGDPVADFAAVIVETRYMKDDLKDEPASVDHDIEITVAATGKTWQVNRVKDADLGTPRKWLEQVDFGRGTAIPYVNTPSGRADIENATRAHGADERRYITILRRTGWVKLPDNEWGYLTPRGTLTRFGIDENVRCKLAIADYGWFTLPDPSDFSEAEKFAALEAAMRSPEEFNDSTAYHAVWGQTMAAVFGKRPEGTVIVAGLKGSAKTYTVQHIMSSFSPKFGYKQKVLGASLRSGTKGVKLNIAAGLHHCPGLLEDVRNIQIQREREVQTEVIDTWIGRGNDGASISRGRLASDNAGGYDQVQGDQSEPLTLITVEKVEYMDLLPASMQRSIVFNMTYESSLKSGSADRLSRISESGQMNLAMSLIIQRIATQIMERYDGDWDMFQKCHVEETFAFVRGNLEDRLPQLVERELTVASMPAVGYVLFGLLLEEDDNFMAFTNKDTGQFEGGCGGPVFDAFVAAAAAHHDSIPDETEVQDNPAERLLALIQSADSSGVMLLKLQGAPATPGEDRVPVAGIKDASVPDPDNNDEMTPVVYLDYNTVAKVLGGGMTASYIRSTLKPLCVRHPGKKNGHRPYLSGNNGTQSRFNAIAVRSSAYFPDRVEDTEPLVF